MGAKFSNVSANTKSLPIVETVMSRNYADNRRDLHSSEIPSIIIDCDEGERRIDVVTKLDPIDCEPHLFPKVRQSVPISNTNWLRIHAIKQKGVKLSDTHYWTIEEPRHKRCQSARVKRNPPEMYVNAKSIGVDPYEEPPLPYDLDEQISNEYVRTRPVKRGQSENHKEYLSNIHQGLVIRMMFQIAGATEMECNSVLIGANWDFEVAEKRLKVDMLHRKGFANQQRCTQLLEMYEWSLSHANHQAEKEFRQMQLERQLSNNSAKSHHSDDTK